MNAMTPKPLIPAGLAVTLLLAGCTSPGYNDNPSQQMTTGRVGCLAATEFFAVYFNVHVQPATDSTSPRLVKEVFRSYCEDIPIPGRVFFTADLATPDLKRMPIGIQVLEQQFDGYDSRLNKAHRTARTIAEFPDTVYTKGVIELQFELDAPGRYAVYLKRGGKEAVTDYDKLRIPLNVATSTGTAPVISRAGVLIGVASLLAAVVVLGYLRGRKNRAKG
jgi:hypothetical protein